MDAAGPQRRSRPHRRPHHRLHWLEVIALLLPALAAVLMVAHQGEARWPDALFLIVTAAATLVAMRKDIPTQNVFLASVVILALASVVEVLGIYTPFPFGPRTYLGSMGDPILGPLPWAAPVLWLALLPNARGVARVMLQTRRTEANYGLWVIGLATLLVSGFAMGLEILAQSRGYWRWGIARTAFNWYGAPWAAYFGYAMAALVLLVLTMPAMIRKQPGNGSTYVLHVYIWGVINSVTAVSALERKAWAAVVVSTLLIVVPVVWAWHPWRRGGRGD